MAINETVLEMHYHKPLMDLFREVYGVGTNGVVNFYKYSPQKEVFIGFDQAYAISELSDEDFFKLLKDSAITNNYKLKTKFLAYFLQFKVVKQMSNISKKLTPAGINNKPHFRIRLDTQKNQNTGFSQHELLFKLNHNASAMVYYACPMIFDKKSLYEINVNLDSLQLVDFDFCPSSYLDNETHYIYFNTPNTTSPVWCSNPIVGKSMSAENFAMQVKNKLDKISPQDSLDNILSLLTYLKTLTIKSSDGISTKSPISFVHDSLTILSISNRPLAKIIF